MLKARISTWVVLLLLAPSAYITANLAISYLEAIFGKWQTAQWQFAFLVAPIPIVFGLLALLVAYLSRANRVLLGACIALSILPCLLFLLVLFRVY